MAAQLNRRLILLCGERSTTANAAESWLATRPPARTLWIGDSNPAEAHCLPASKARTQLGGEYDVLIFDAFAGFDPDAFGACVGTIRGGGVILLLAPVLAAWPDYPDPDLDRIAAHPWRGEQLRSRYLTRLADLLAHHPTVTHLDTGNPSDLDQLSAIGPTPTKVGRNLEPGADQALAIQAVLRVARGHRRRPALLVADRGRGKSAAMGMAAAELLATHQILVTAPSRRAADALFEHARLALGSRTDLLERLRFVAPDQLCRELPRTDLLLVDEAAAIPLAMLQELLTHHARIAFATTVHGYEGAGRGFAIRFRERLDRETPQWRQVELREPIRWAAGDAVEALSFDALLLNAEPAALAAAPGEETHIERLDPDQLARDEALLRQVFGLLVGAHYQTRPQDLRNLLDGPDIQVWASFAGRQVVATLLISREGGFAPELCEAIQAGRRRPRGHLLPQTLAFHGGHARIAELRIDRVMRIAVHPRLRRRGLGRRLLRTAMARSLAESIDLFGTSFGIDAELLTFWQALGLEPVRIGNRRETASGEHSGILLKPLSAAGQVPFTALRQRFLQDLPWLLAEPLARLEPELVIGLSPTQLVESPNLNQNDIVDLQDFAQGHRQYLDCLPALWRLTAQGWRRGALRRLPARQAALLITRVLQRRDWRTIADQAQLNGRAGVITQLRAAVGTLLEP